jgi:hypothetical protein
MIEFYWAERWWAKLFPLPTLKKLTEEEIHVTELELHKSELELERMKANVVMLTSRLERLNKQKGKVNGN